MSSKKYEIELDDLTGETEHDLNLLKKASLKNLHYLVYQDFKEAQGVISDYNFGVRKLEELKFLPYLFETIKKYDKFISILDAGCGNGEVLLDLLRSKNLPLNFILAGLDINAIRLGKETKKRIEEYIKEESPNIQLFSYVCEDQSVEFNTENDQSIYLISGDIHEVDCIPDNVFDIIITHRLFSFVVDAVKALAQCIRMLKPKGVLFIPKEHLFKSGTPRHYLEMEMDDETERKYLINQLLSKKSKITLDQLQKEHKVDTFEAINYLRDKFTWTARIGLDENESYIRVEKISSESPKNEDIPHFVGTVYGEDVNFILYRREQHTH